MSPPFHKPSISFRPEDLLRNEAHIPEDFNKTEDTGENAVFPEIVVNPVTLTSVQVKSPELDSVEVKGEKSNNYVKISYNRRDSKELKCQEVKSCFFFNIRPLGSQVETGNIN